MPISLGIGPAVTRSQTIGGAVAPFTPAALFGGGESGEWWSPSSGYRFEDAGTTPAADDGDALYQINGQRGVANLVESSASVRPLLELAEFGARDAMHFDATNDQMGVASLCGITPAGPRTMWWFGRLASSDETPVFGQFFNNVYTDGALVIAPGLGAAGKWSIYVADSVPASPATASLNSSESIDQSYHRHIVVIASAVAGQPMLADVTYYLDGVPLNLSGAADWLDISEINSTHLGVYSGAAYSKEHYTAECGLINRAISPAEVALLDAWGTP